MDKLNRNLAVDRLAELQQLCEAYKNDNSLKSSLLARLSLLSGIVSSFEASHLSILNKCKPVDIDGHQEIRRQFDALHFSILETKMSMETQASQSTSSNHTIPVKLPELALKHFSGDARDYISFKEIFNKSIHLNTNLNPISKFQYLLSCLKSEPFSLVSNLPLTVENYQLALEILDKRYLNIRKIAFLYFDALYHIKYKASCAISLRKIVDCYNENLALLKNIGLNVNSWDFPLFYILINKLDSDMRHKFELTRLDNNIPTLQILLDFLEIQAQALERLNVKLPQTSVVPSPKQSHSSPKFAKRSTFVGAVEVGKPKITCSLCNKPHKLHQCIQFKNKTPEDRFKICKEKHLCLNCLSASHTVKACTSPDVCSICQQRHTTLLHFNRSKPVVESEGRPTPSNMESGSPQTPSNVNICFNKHTSAVLLPTALVKVTGKNFVENTVRILIDTGSSANLITESLASKLDLHKKPHSVILHGVNKTQSSATKGITSLTLESLINPDRTLHISALIVPHLIDTRVQPSFVLDKSLEDLQLSDPNLGQNSPIDILLGVDTYSRLILDGVRTSSTSNVSAFNTIFGWVLVGKPDFDITSLASLCINVEEPSLDDTLKAFWQTETCPSQVAPDPDTVKCEEHFEKTHSRLPDGRYSVALPFKNSSANLEHSKALALSRLKSLEVKFDKDPLFTVAYKNFMEDYLGQGHMSLSSPLIPPSPGYFIPHHSVYKQDGEQRKIRVVFDASAGQYSLNNALFVGPKLQPDIVRILVQFRIYPIAVVTDIKQMYRQILVEPSDRDFQRILWRFSPSDPIQEYRLNTVTYGVTTSPYLALRTLKQLVVDEGQDFPLASRSLLHETYIDDIVSGADSIPSALKLKQELVSLLDRGKFKLHKWASNSTSISSHIDDVAFEDTSFVKLLGLQWQPTLDIFTFKHNNVDQLCTKRTMLSHIARLYDPCGFIAPTTFVAKRLIQKLWCLGIEWDDPPPLEIQNTWRRFVSEMPLLKQIALPRVIAYSGALYELHAFADASELGYAACVYLRVRTPSQLFVHLLLGKTKVAPLNKLSIPKLELCAAVLLSQLVKLVLEILKNYISIDRVVAWTDSMVVLAWVKSSPHRWKTFVANRVTQIQEIIPPTQWFHVPTTDNPADCGSRGLFPSEIVDHPLWYSGPPWLSSSNLESYLTIPPTVRIEEEVKSVVLVTNPVVEPFQNLIEKFSSLQTILKITIYIRRFVNACRHLPFSTGSPNAVEYDEASLSLVKFVQYSCFSEEISAIQRSDTVPKSFRKLAGFIDTRGFVRVGGRLHHTNLSFNRKHPLLLPKEHCLSRLIITDLHQRYLHASGNNLINIVMERYWIFGLRSLVRNITANCIKCFRTSPRPMIPYMGDLPLVRVSQFKCFSQVGLDYGGPFLIALKRHRGVRPTKAYICLFVCLATKACHIELASDLTADCFLAALRRFIARRGRCSTIFSDNGTNFVGASRILSRLMKEAAVKERIDWKFYPPASPHFNGLAEAGIKSVKTHLKRVIGNQILSYEEFLTVLTQIEAVLNSRPLCPLKTDVHDLEVLTPGHFLTQESLVAVPVDDLSNLTLNRLDRWQLVQRFVFDIWKRWHREYLHTLQQRSKWNTPGLSPKVGWLVVIQDPNLPPLRWLIGRIVEVHPGHDGLIRVVTVRTASGLLKRPITKVCLFPKDINQ